MVDVRVVRVGTFLKVILMSSVWVWVTRVSLVTGEVTRVKEGTRAARLGSCGLAPASPPPARVLVVRT